MGGFGDWVSSAWRTVRDTAVRAYTTAKDAVVGVTHAIKSGTTSVINTIGSVAKTVYGDAKGVVNFVGKQIDKGTTAGANAITGLGQAISSPITWIALAIGGVLLLPMLTKA